MATMNTTPQKVMAVSQSIKQVKEAINKLHKPTQASGKFALVYNTAEDAFYIGSLELWESGNRPDGILVMVGSLPGCVTLMKELSGYE